MCGKCYREWSHSDFWAKKKKKKKKRGDDIIIGPHCPAIGQVQHGHYLCLFVESADCTKSPLVARLTLIIGGEIYSDPLLKYVLCITASYRNASRVFFSVNLVGACERGFSQHAVQREIFL